MRPPTATPGDWDAATYDRIAVPQEQWGLRVLERLELSGRETVLDAGCGSGRTTRHLLERLPEGRVIGVDASPAMIAQARDSLGDDPRLELVVGDLLELDLAEPVDVVFSNAAFHWIGDHERLFRCLFAALRPGGRLEAQCGGEGNVAELEHAVLALQGDQRFAPYLRGIVRPWNFAGVGDTRTRLERAGFDVSRVWLEETDYSPRDPGAWIAASGLSRYLGALPEKLGEQFVDSLIGSLPRPVTFHYVRLNISAGRPA